MNTTPSSTLQNTIVHSECITEQKLHDKVRTLRFKDVIDSKKPKLTDDSSKLSHMPSFPLPSILKKPVKLFGTPVTTGILPDDTNTVIRTLDSFLWLINTHHRDTVDGQIYKTLRVYLYRSKKDNYIVVDRVLCLTNGNYTSKCDGKCIHARDVEEYTFAYQQEKNITNMVVTRDPNGAVDLFVPPVMDLMTEYIMLVVDVAITDHKLPKTHRQAMLSPDRDEWIKAEQLEIQSMKSHKVFIPMVLPRNKTAIETKWVYVIKYKNGLVNKYKARLVAKGYEQIQGIDYDETYAPVARLTSLRLVLAISAILGFQIHQMDVETAFLNAELKEEVYISVPEGVELAPGCNCFQLRKALYGLKQSPREWYNNINAFLVSLSFHRLTTEHCLYFYNQDQNICIISLYVDDLIIAGSSSYIIDEIKRRLSQEYTMKDLGFIDEILGCKVHVDTVLEVVTVHQHKYLNSVIAKFTDASLTSANTPADPKIVLSTTHCPQTDVDVLFMKSIPYREAVGSLLWLSLGSRPDIAYAVSQVAKFNGNPGPTHWTAVLRIFRYLSHTRMYGLTYSRSNHNAPHEIQTSVSSAPHFLTDGDVLRPTCFVDSDYARCIDSRRSVTGFIFMLAGAPLSWQSRQQPSVALSSMESEYMAACAAAQEAVWLIQLLKEFTCQFFHPVVIFEDNSACIAYVKNNNNPKRSKHIDVRYHFITDLVHANVITMVPVRTTDNIADIMTKPLDKHTFARLASSFMRVLT